MKGKRTVLLLLVFLVPLIVIFSQCFNREKQQEDPRGRVYAGSASCAKCHQDIYSSYLQTAHQNTSRPASVHSIHGSFAANHNSFLFENGLQVKMEKRGNKLFQVAYKNNKEIEKHRFDISFGGIKAETYLSWNGNELFQLPISYFNALNSWTNSPGYAANQIDFNRPILRRCFECHSSYIKELPLQTQSLTVRKVEFDQHTLIYGIDCERCHGPAANHVNFHTDFPEVKTARYMVKYDSLSRIQKLNMCAVCHSGNKSNFLISAFAYTPGKKLEDFKEPDFMPANPNAPQLDVHGNQNQLLATSQCFIKSNMDCSSCHNTHVNERANLVLYSQRCINCHKNSIHNFTKNEPALNALLQKNCIDCHMPAKPSNVIVVQTSGKGNANPYLVRTHHIAVYPDESKKILAFLKISKTNAK